MRADANACGWKYGRKVFNLQADLLPACRELGIGEYATGPLLKKMQLTMLQFSPLALQICHGMHDKGNQDKIAAAQEWWLTAPLVVDSWQVSHSQQGSVQEYRCPVCADKRGWYKGRMAGNSSSQILVLVNMLHYHNAGKYKNLDNLDENDFRKSQPRFSGDAFKQVCIPTNYISSIPGD